MVNCCIWFLLFSTLREKTVYTHAKITSNNSCERFTSKAIIIMDQKANWRAKCYAAETKQWRLTYEATEIFVMVEQSHCRESIIFQDQIKHQLNYFAIREYTVYQKGEWYLEKSFTYWLYSIPKLTVDWKEKRKSSTSHYHWKVT